MISITVQEPESGIVRELKIHPVNNYAYPGWIVFIAEQKNIFLYLQNGTWEFLPTVISVIYARQIGLAIEKTL